MTKKIHPLEPTFFFTQFLGQKHPLSLGIKLALFGMALPISVFANDTPSDTPTLQRQRASLPMLSNQTARQSRATALPVSTARTLTRQSHGSSHGNGHGVSHRVSHDVPTYPPSNFQSSSFQSPSTPIVTETQGTPTHRTQTVALSTANSPENSTARPNTVSTEPTRSLPRTQPAPPSQGSNQELTAAKKAAPLFWVKADAQTQPTAQNNAQRTTQNTAQTRLQPTQRTQTIQRSSDDVRIDSLTHANQSSSLDRLKAFYRPNPKQDSQLAEPAIRPLATLIQEKTAQSNPEPSLKPSSEPSQALPYDPSRLATTPKNLWATAPVVSAASCQGSWAYPAAPTPYHLPNGASYAAANYGYFNNKDYAELSGNVLLQQNDRQVRADKLTFNPLTGHSQAFGNVIFGHTAPTPAQSGLGVGDLMGIAGALTYNTQNSTASVRDVAFASTSLHAHGYAQSLNRPNDTQYHLENVLFSTCPPAQRLWHLDAKDIKIDTETGRGIATNSTLKIKDTPILYLPYFNFPIDNRRSSGFLVPSLGINSSDGLQISTPYYFNLAPNYDATLTPTLYSNRNPRLSGEFRYLTHYGAGKIDAAYLPNDQKYHRRDRSHLFFDHNWQPMANVPLDVFATYRYVSDSSYLSDFDSLGLENNPLNLPRRIGANYQGENLQARLHAETFQTLEGTDHQGNPILDKDRPYARLPELSVNYRIPQTLAPNLQLFGTSHNAYFKKSINDNSAPEKSGVRLYNQLSAAYPVFRSWGYATPKVSLSHLHVSYDEDSLAGQNLSREDGSYSVFSPSFHLDTGLFFEKPNAPFNWQTGGHQLLSPRLKYSYAPKKDQSQLPNFETTYRSISYDQLFSDSWFLGYDRVSDLHAVTPALNYRYVDGMGNTRIDASIGEQYYLRPMQASLGNDRLIQSDRSGIAWQAALSPARHLWVDVSGSFAENYRPNSFVGAVRYEPYANMFFNVGVIERKRDDNLGQLPLSAYTASAIFPINEKWQLITATQYDRKYGGFMDTLFGVGYEDCCIGVSVYGRQYRNDLNPDDVNRAVMAEVKLSGLTGNGKLSRLLQEKIFGYTPLPTWQRAY